MASLRGVGVYALSEDGERVLLTQRGPAARHGRYKWEGPGGRIEDGESFEDGARREIREELGVDIELTGDFGKYREAEDENGETWGEKSFTAILLGSPTIQEPDKCVGFGWFTRAEVQALADAGLLATYAVTDFRHAGWL